MADITMRILLVILCACSQEDAAGDPDLSVADLSEGDRSMPDAAPPGDLSDWCSGTAVAGTCLQTFFAPLAACFDAMGSCVYQSSSGGIVKSYCWNNGAQATETFGVGQQSWTFESSSGATCFTWLNEATDSTISAGGANVHFQPATGDYTCGGTSGTVGANCGGCAELCALFKSTPSCTAGTCP
jgi:hypothetical protein